MWPVAGYELFLGWSQVSGEQGENSTTRFGI